MSKFLFVNNALNGTGGPRVILNLASALIEAGHEVCIVVDRVDNVDFEIDNKIILYRWDLFNIKSVHSKSVVKTTISKPVGSLDKLSPRLKKVARTIRDIKYSLLSPIYSYTLSSFVKRNRFDIVVNSNIYVGVERNLFCSKFIKNYFVSFHNSPSEVFSRNDYFKFFSQKILLENINYVAVSNAIKEELNIIGFTSKIQKVIYNGFDFDVIRKLSTIDGCNQFDKNYILSISTLSERKRVDRLIRAFAKNKDLNNNYDLIILGEGHLKNNLVQLCNELNVSNKVKFLGFQSNPYKFLSECSGLVLSSDSEGLPTVIIESLILGKPVVSTDCPTGPAEILEPWGERCLVELYKIDDQIVDELAIKVFNILNEDYSSEFVKQNSKLLRFDKKNIIKEWEALCFQKDI